MALLLVSSLLLGACPDGYPTQDAPHVDPARMTQAQLLQSLNDLGREPQLGKRWRYELVQDCELRVRVRDGEPVERRVTLEGATVGQRSQDGVTEVLLIPEAGDESAAVVVLESRRWPDTVRIRSLLAYLEASCGRPPVPNA